MKTILFVFMIAITSFLTSCSEKKWDEKTKPVLLEFKLVKNATDKNHLIIEDKILIDNNDIAGACVVSDKYGWPVIQVKMTSSGALALKTITENNINKQIAVLFDGKIISTPEIRAPISRGMIQLPIPEHCSNKEAEGIAAGILKYKEKNH